MNGALVVVSHPDPASLNHALAKVVVDAWESLGFKTRFVDLHALGFDPVMSPEEARGCATDDAKVQEQIALLVKSVLVGVVHPNCWGSPPAMMKGWMDRVFAPGAAYAFAKGEDDGRAPKGLLRDKRALVLNTSNTTGAREQEAFGDPLERIWRDCLLGYCGFERVDRQVYRVVANSTKEERRDWLADAGLRAIKLAGQPIRP
ncbi:putative NADPH-quinone reductase [Granulicella aggregans]|uniref:Putative NADPH-quinone reductase n=1 Tax=Granulicella aggregans TaxID=474949 RepID=A0A7W8E645_9BACT|nr:NAD(P)H-dependent oxidoreductase [Granulicella aggregans]MBB5060286.1 putative NADPH-quinone reductase [Granulicella aggregans]